MSSPPDPARRGVRPLVIFFILVFCSNGLGDYDNGLLVQPVSNYFKNGLGLSADDVASYLFWLAVPWFVTPIYSVISEFFPILGYRRKTYLFAANIVSSAAVLWATGLTEPTAIIFALIITSLNIAISVTLCCAIMVEKGKQYNLSSEFVDIQWICFYAGVAAACFLSGWLTQHLTPLNGFRAAAFISAVPPLLVLCGCWLLLPAEPKVAVDVAGFKKTMVTLAGTAKVPAMWLLGLFLFFFNFSPGFQTPLYYYMGDHLHFDQQFIGQLSGIMAVGNILGGFFSNWLQRRMDLKTVLYWSIVLAVVSQGAWFWLDGETSAIILSIFYGFTTMIALVSALGLAAELTPSGAEGFAYAFMVAICNVSYQLADKYGSAMFDNWFNHSLNPLIVISSVTTAAAALFLPFLKIGGTTSPGGPTKP